MDRLVAQANFESALCSAFTGEDIKYTTITRGVLFVVKVLIKNFTFYQEKSLSVRQQFLCLVQCSLAHLLTC